ncbi:MAG TPA: hypothetical protein VFW28_04110 [Micropepsaceae bacterium]|nr:hypothetical protein [Micropepsaceae bacterium]
MSPGRNLLASTAAGALLVVSGSAAADAQNVPALSGQWGRSNFNLEQPANGPVLIGNTLHKKDGTIDDDAGRLGDYKSPLLTPAASAILKAHGEFSMTGQSIPDPHNQCWPEPPPFTMIIQLEMMLLQRPDEVVLIYSNGQRIRHIRLNSSHPTPLVPTYAGDSIGHYEGDTLVVDTVGIKPGKWPVIDRYGTPRSDALHVTERYRLIDGKAAENAMVAHHREFTKAAVAKEDAYGGIFDPDTSRNGLQVEVTVDDPKMFTRPYTGFVTYRPQSNWPEMICDDPPSLTNTTILETGAPRQGPIAAKADF